jgi:sugar phosphate isomerase/epimerase
MAPKLGLYSISYAGMWYDGPALSIQAFVDRARRFGFEGVELDGRAPHALPYLLDEDDRKAIVDYVGEQGIELAALAANNDFSSPVIEHRDAHVQMVIAMIELCRDLGAPVLRVFTAWRGSSTLNGRGTYEVARPGYGLAYPQTPEMDRWKYCLEAFRIVTRFAEDAGVVLALQNHPPVVRNSADCLAMAQEIDSPNFKLSFDVSGERAWQDSEWILGQARAIGDRWAHSHFSGDFVRAADGTVERVPLGRALGPRAGNMSWNYDAWVQAMVEVGYDGYVCYEACTPTYLPNGELVPIETIDERVQLGREFMLDRFDRYAPKEGE